MREKLQTLPLTQLRELAKAQGLKGVTTLKKAEIIDRLCEIAGGKQQTKIWPAWMQPGQKEAAYTILFRRSLWRRRKRKKQTISLRRRSIKNRVF